MASKKKLYVASQVQKALLEQVLIPEMASGFWKNDRPADHAQQWQDVEIIITDDGNLGAVDFVVPRLYNFVNPGFIKPNEDRLVEVAVSAKSSSNFRSVKKELIELSRIVGGRLTTTSGVPTKANRGNNKGGTIQEAVKKAKETTKKAGDGVKKTAVKKGTTTTKKGNTTVKRTPVVKADSTAPDESKADTPDQEAQVNEAVQTITQAADAIAESATIVQAAAEDVVAAANEQQEVKTAE